MFPILIANGQPLLLRKHTHCLPLFPPAHPFTSSHANPIQSSVKASTALHRHPRDSTPNIKRSERKSWPYLILRMALRKQNIHNTNLVHVAMPLKFLPHLRAQCRHGYVQRVHGLDLWRLISLISISGGFFNCCHCILW
jgi:hypothetical protein